MKKITLAEKIRRAEARVLDAEAAIRVNDYTIERWQATLNNIDDTLEAFSKYDRRPDTAFLKAVRERYVIAENIALAEWDIPRLKARLAHRRAYLRKLRNMQAEIEREAAEYEAEVGMLIDFAESIA